MHSQHLLRATKLFLFCASISAGTAYAQYGGYRYNHYGQLVDGRGQLANPHQEMHDMENPLLYTTGAVAVSNTTDPNFTQSTLTQIESAMAPTPEPGGQAMSRLYLTPTNPYTPGGGVQSGAPTGYNYDHYNQILLDAPVGGYVPTQSGAYIAKTHPDSSSELYNRGFNTYEDNPKFLAAKEAAGGLGGGVVFFVNQSAESFSHLRAVSGSNVYMTAYVRPPSGGVVVLGGQVVLNPQHNTSPALDTNQYGPAYVAGVSQIQGQTLDTGNEAGFWVTGTGSATQIANWGDGSANSIAAAYNPDAQFHVHTHTGDAGPSYVDMINSAALNGMPGMVISSNGNYAYGFQVESGWLPTPDGVVVFKQRKPGVNDGNMGGYDSWGPESVGGYSSGDYSNSAGADISTAAAGAFMGGGFGTLAGGVGLGAIGTFASDVAMDAGVLSHAPWSGYTSGWNQDQDESVDSTSNDSGTGSGGSSADGGFGYGGRDGNTAPDGSAINGF